MSIDEMVDNVDKELIQEIKKLGLNEKELKQFLKSYQVGNSPAKEYVVGKDKIKFGVIADTHIGSKYYDSKLMDFASKQFSKEKVDFVAHVGDICEGMYNNRQGHVFELDAIGGDAQVNKAVKELSKIKQPLYFITGNHEGNTFYKNAGFEIGSQIEEKVKGSKFLGNGEGIIKLKGGANIMLMHPDGGSSYAISYKSQKLIESLEGGKKPNVLLVGHFHKAEYIFYRNIHCLQAGTLQNQTSFMRGKQLAAMKGFYIVELNTNGKEVSSIKPTFYPAYD